MSDQDHIQIQIQLPYPPTVNTYWRRVGHRTLLSKRGREFKQAVCEAVAEQLPPHTGTLQGRLEVVIQVWPPDLRKRDLDNLPKAVLDALAAAAVFLDDSQVDRLVVVRCPPAPRDGAAVVWIRELQPLEGAG